MEYKGYTAVVRYDPETERLSGKILNIQDLVMFEADSVPDLKVAFQRSVDRYLSLCEKHQRNPDKPFSGKFLVRLDPDLHRRVATAAETAGKSLNAWITKILSEKVRAH